MARVRVTGSVRVGNRRVRIKRIEDFATILPMTHAHTVEATAAQARVIAEEARELVVGKLYAGPVGVVQTPAGRQAGARVVSQPTPLRRPDIGGEERRPFRHPPLSPRTIRRKIREGNDGRKLIETGEYTQGIEVVRTEQSEAGVVYRVRPAPRQHKGADPESSPITHKMLARVHEFGSAQHKIPARPHWGPSIRAVRRKFERLPANIKAEALRAALREIR